MPRGLVPPPQTTRQLPTNMSGNATTEPTRRITDEEHTRVLEEIRQFLNKLEIPHIPVTPLSGKTSHGDIDIVVSEEAWMANNTEAVGQTKGNNSGGGLSFPEGVIGQQSRQGFTHVAWPMGDGTYVQVDFIRTPEQHLVQTKTYLSHGTLGNVIGLVCRSIGLRYKMVGLHMIARHPNGQKCGSLEIETDPEKCLRIIGFPEDDIQRLLTGTFHDREDYYPVPTRLPFFHTDYIHPERMTAPNRGRDKKRPEIVPYRNWLLENNILQDWDLPERSDEENYLRYQFTWIRRLIGEEKHEELLALQKEMSETLNARMGPKAGKRLWFEETSKMAGVDPKEIGKTVYELANADNITVDAFIQNHTPEQASVLIQEKIQNSAMNDKATPTRLLCFVHEQVIPAEVGICPDGTLRWQLGPSQVKALESGLPVAQYENIPRIYIPSMGQVFLVTGVFLTDAEANAHCEQDPETAVIATQADGIVICAKNKPAIPILPEFAGYIPRGPESGNIEIPQ
jgi:hypothetical protein